MSEPEYYTARELFEQALHDLQTESAEELRRIADGGQYHGWYRRAAAAVLKARGQK